MAFFALTRAEDPVVEGVQRVAEVGLLKAVVVQNFQSVENPADGEAYRGGKITPGQVKQNHARASHGSNKH